MTDTEEDSFLATTPQEGPKCLRHSPCMQPACLTCFPSATGDHHVLDLSQDLGTTPGPKSKPTTQTYCSPDHIISTILEDFQQASSTTTWTRSRTSSRPLNSMFWSTQITSNLTALNWPNIWKLLETLPNHSYSSCPTNPYSSCP